MPDTRTPVGLPDVNRLAADLATALTRHKQLVADEAQKRVQVLAVQYAKEADQRIRNNAVELQRAQDLVAELRRQLAPAGRAADKAALLADAIRRAHYAGQTVIDVRTLLDILDTPDGPLSPDANQAPANRTTSERNPA